MKTTDDAEIAVPYNHDLKPLEDVLAVVQRPGDFFVRGVLETPMPRIEIDGVGVISFPVPDTQIQDIIKGADRAPYGRGDETILDASVRNAWQLAPASVHIGGKSWQRSFEHILSAIADGLGCEGMDVSAEFYNLLIYEKWGFFLPHRDTEKTDGMFGTLTMVLPSAHRGGELVVRHAGREVTLDLSNADVSELAFAAFYADCEHEIKPITQGARVCLTYNLILRKNGGKQNGTIKAPLYDTEVDRAGAILADTFNKAGAPAKLAWLLEHQYSPAGLSLADLKGRDAALVKVLQRAAERAECALHLGIVHIEESGSAVSHFAADYGRRGRRGRSYSADAFAGDDDSEDVQFEVIEVSDSSEHIDQWIDMNGRAVEFGSLPIMDGEILPAGGLDGEAPDRQRLTEATGNEGASFERSYHRAALIIWPRNRFVDVLLQAGPNAALPYLKDCVQACNVPSESTVARQTAHSVAERIVDAWEAGGNDGFRHRNRQTDRNSMIALLGQMEGAPLLERFIARVVTREYDGSENEALAANVQRLGPIQAEQLLSRLTNENVRSFLAECVDLLSRLTRECGIKAAAGDWIAALRGTAAAIVDSLPKLVPRRVGQADREWWRTRKARTVDSTTVADLLETLVALNAGQLRDIAGESIVANVEVFDPAMLIVPALQLLDERNGEALIGNKEFQRLWRHGAEFLLARSERPPEPPKNWRQDVSISCRCDDCRELQTFSLDGGAETHRFRVKQERRQHLHHQISHHDLDMTHLTERSGSPQTLVCTKTRRMYERQCEQHKLDLASMAVLRALLPEKDGDMAALAARLDEAARRRL